MKRGTVYLVGAGPGDPDLLTVKAKRVLEKADAVIYDRLINKKILSYAGKDAEFIYVGKTPGNHALSQENINELLVKKAREDNVVVRLKGGDPFVFGRGGEEALYLVDHGCDFEIVPGVTSAIAVPAYAGIPVTHRESASSFSVITGHEKPGKKESSIPWNALSRETDTLVFLMGMGNIAFIVEQLTAKGKDCNTPVALVRCGTLPEQEILSGTLGNIVQKVNESSFQPPAVLIVGEVVKLREKLSWAEKRPLWGKRIVVTRPQAQAGSLVEKITERGGVVVELPVIEIVKEKDLQKLQYMIENLQDFDWVLFTSVNAVDIFFREMAVQMLDARIFKGISVGAIGPVTGHRLKQYGLLTDLIPRQYSAEGIIEALKKHIQPGQNILLPRAQGARTILPEELKALGATIEEIALYRAATSPDISQEAAADIRQGNIDMITFTSSSTVSAFVDIIGKEHVRTVDATAVVACIGPITADTARAAGFGVDIVAEKYTIEGLVEAIVREVKR